MPGAQDTSGRVSSSGVGVGDAVYCWWPFVVVIVVPVHVV